MNTGSAATSRTRSRYLSAMAIESVGVKRAHEVPCPPPSTAATNTAAGQAHPPGGRRAANPSDWALTGAHSDGAPEEGRRFHAAPPEGGLRGPRGRALPGQAPQNAISEKVLPSTNWASLLFQTFTRKEPWSSGVAAVTALAPALVEMPTSASLLAKTTVY